MKNTNTKRFTYQEFLISNQEKRERVAERARQKTREKNNQKLKGVKYFVEDLGDKFVVVAELEES